MADAPAWDVPPGFGDWTLLTTTATSDVYVAASRDTGRRTVVKILRVDSADDATELFIEGTDAAEGLPPHPLIVPVTGRGTTPGGRPWVSMPFLPYGSLTDRLTAEGPLPPRLATEIFVWVADALAFTTSVGVLHRDVKPGNILFDAEGRPVLADFQTATRLRAGRQSATTAALTDQYAAAEVLIDGRYNAQSEVFSVCASMLQALGGRPPHELHAGEPLRAYLQRVDAGTAVDQVVLPDVPRVIADLIRQGLARDPDLRPRGSAGLAKALREAQASMGWPVTGPVETAAPPDPPTVMRKRPLATSTTGSSAAALPAPHSWRRRGLVIGPPVFALLVLAVLLAAYVRPAVPGDTARAASTSGTTEGTETSATPGSGGLPPERSTVGAETATAPQGAEVAPQGAEVPNPDGGPLPAPDLGTLPDPDAGEIPARPGDGNAVRPADVTPSAPREETSGTSKRQPPPTTKDTTTTPRITLTPPTITQAGLPNATVGRAYHASLTATGGQTPYTWDLLSGQLPGGLSLAGDGTIAGTPSESFSGSLTVRIRDAAGQIATAQQSLSAVALRGDVNRDGEVDCGDAALLKAAWDWGEGTRAGDPADLNGDNGVNALDYSIMASNWTGSSDPCP